MGYKHLYVVQLCLLSNCADYPEDYWYDQLDLDFSTYYVLLAIKIMVNYVVKLVHSWYLNAHLEHSSTYLMLDYWTV